jgi:hypothetical protein
MCKDIHVYYGMRTLSASELLRLTGPVAKGSLCEVRKSCSRPGCRACRSGLRHPAWLFTYRKDGKAHSLHVPRGLVEVVRRALENGRCVEQLIVEAGVALIRERHKG